MCNIDWCFLLLYLIFYVFLRNIIKSHCLNSFPFDGRLDPRHQNMWDWLTDKFIGGTASPLDHSTPNHCSDYKYSPKNIKWYIQYGMDKAFQDYTNTLITSLGTSTGSEAMDIFHLLWRGIIWFTCIWFIFLIWTPITDEHSETFKLSFWHNCYTKASLLEVNVLCFFGEYL